MFRLGGNTDQGIISGVVPRQGFAESGMAQDYEEKLALLNRVALPPDRSRSDFMIDWGLGMVSGEPKGNILSTAAHEAKEPFQRYRTAQAQRAEMGTKLGLSAATSAMAHADKMAQIAEAARYKNVTDPMDEMKKLATEYLEDYAGDWTLAMNKARFHLEVRPKLATAFGETQVGGIIDQGDLGQGLAPKKQQQKVRQWMEKNQSKIGQVFYDVNDGQIKRLIQQPGTNTLGFEVIDPATLTGVVAADTDTQVQEQKVVSTGLSQEQAEVEAAKRGLTLITRPDDAPRGWLSSEKRKNPNVITKEQLEEIIRQEEFSAATENIKQSSNIR